METVILELIEECKFFFLGGAFIYPKKFFSKRNKFLFFNIINLFTMRNGSDLDEMLSQINKEFGKWTTIKKF